MKENTNKTLDKIIVDVMALINGDERQNFSDDELLKKLRGLENLFSDKKSYFVHFDTYINQVHRASSHMFLSKEEVLTSGLNIYAFILKNEQELNNEIDNIVLTSCNEI